VVPSTTPFFVKVYLQVRDKAINKRKLLIYKLSPNRAVNATLELGQEQFRIREAEKLNVVIEVLL
jgi:hypothetical protein